MNTAEWLEDVRKKYGEEAASKCAEIIAEAERLSVSKRLHLVLNACSDVAKHVESYNVNVDCSAAMRAVIEAMIDEGYRKP